MMTAAAVLEIIREFLELANRIAADMPADQKAQFWADVKSTHDGWKSIADSLRPNQS